MLAACLQMRLWQAGTHPPRCTPRFPARLRALWLMQPGMRDLCQAGARWVSQMQHDIQLNLSGHAPAFALWHHRGPGHIRPAEPRKRVPAVALLCVEPSADSAAYEDICLAQQHKAFIKFMLLCLQVFFEEIPDEQAGGPIQKAPDAASSTARTPTTPISAPVTTRSSKETTKDDNTAPLAPSVPAPHAGKYRCAYHCSCWRMQAAVRICGLHPAGAIRAGHLCKSVCEACAWQTTWLRTEMPMAAKVWTD